LPGTKKNCFCANTEAEEDETRPFYFDAANPDPFYKSKAKAVNAKNDKGVFTFGAKAKSSYYGFSSESFVMGKRNVKEPTNPEGLPNKNFEVSFSFNTKKATGPLFCIDNPSTGGHDRHIYLKNN